LCHRTGIPDAGTVAALHEGMNPSDLLRPLFVLGLIATSLLMMASIARADDQIVEGVIADQPYDGYRFGVGAVVGDPTALTLKGRFDSNNALQLHVGWGPIEPNGGRLTFALDYLAHFTIFSSETAKTGALSPYVGLGAKMGIREEPDAVVLGARVPLGLAFLFREAPIELFLEVVPGVYVFPAVAALVDGGIGARVYF
jgi:hypothetical protein